MADNPRGNSDAQETEHTPTAETTAHVPASETTAHDPASETTVHLPTSETKVEPTPYTTPATMATDKPRKAGVRVSTVVWGLVVFLVGLCLMAVAFGARIDAQLVFVAILVIAGLGLIAGAVLAAIKSRR